MSRARLSKCTNSHWPDIHGHYREAKFTQVHVLQWPNGKYTALVKGSEVKCSGLHKVVILVIRDNGISHFMINFSLEIQYKIPNKRYFWQNKFLSQKQVSVTETSYCNTKTFFDRNRFPSQKTKQNDTKKSFFQKKSFCINIYSFIFFRKKVSITVSFRISIRETNFCQRKNSLCHRKSFWPLI